MRATLLGLLAVGSGLLALAPAPPASADDRSLREAGRSRDAQFAELGQQSRSRYRAWRRSGHSRAKAKPLLATLRATLREIRAVRAAVEPERASSRYGRAYKRYLLLALGDFAGAKRAEAKGVRAWTAGRRAEARSAFALADRRYRRASRRERRALRAIRRVVPD